MDTPLDESSPHASRSSPICTPSSSGGEEITREIVELVNQMVISMPAPEVDNATYVAGAEKMFARYPIEACREVADASIGYPATESFAPTLASLRLALEAAARPYLLKREREARERKLAQERAEAAAPSGPRPSYAELQRRCAALGLVIGAKRRRKQIDTAAESARVREQYGISQAAWDATPKAGT
jgi:hypothetical protein